MIKNLAHVCIMARDLAETERFYCDLLGFERVFDFIREGNVAGYYLKVSGRTYVEVFQSGESTKPEGFPIRHICFEVDDIEATLKRLRDGGYEVTEKKLGADHSWQAWVTDPSGVRIEFHEYTDESSQVTGRNCALD